MATFLGARAFMPTSTYAKLFQFNLSKASALMSSASSDDNRRSFGTFRTVAPKMSNKVSLGNMEFTKQQARDLSTALRLGLNGGPLLAGRNSPNALFSHGGLTSQSVAHSSHGSVFNMGPMMVTLWTTIMAANLTGLIGYCIGPTVHLAVVFPAALALWLSVVASSATHNINEFLAHLVPPGSPLVLAPFLCVIEAVSILIRPITLSVRLVANLSAGHLILGLIGGGVVSGGFLTQSLSLGVSTFYVAFEVFVAMIQTYIFCNLLSLYADEHS